MDANGFIRFVFRHIERANVRAFVRLSLTAALIGASHVAHAVLITFDDLVAPPCTPEFCESLVVDNQYAALGVTFAGTGLYSNPDAPQLVTSPQGLSDVYGPGMSIYFTGSLPTSVKMYVSSFNQDVVGATASGPNGFSRTVATDGWAGTEENSTPYSDKQVVEFAGGEIARIDLASFFDRRGAIVIDNLEFTRDISVPLPAALPLLASGLSALGLAGLRGRNARQR